MGQSSAKPHLDTRLDRKVFSWPFKSQIEYIRVLLNDDPSLREYRDEYKMICLDIEESVKKYKVTPSLGFIFIG
jgi:hypothetical protein